MKSFFRFNVFLTMILVLIFTYSCKKTDEINKEKISGYVQKGPFINGTTIQMYELNSSLNQTGKVFSTEITDNKGTFEINNVALSSRYVEFLANGYYFNEATGTISPSQLSLSAIADIKDISTVNVNILTHLEKGRLEYLIGQGMDFAQAKDSAQNEVLEIFGFTGKDMDNSEMLDISVDKEENAILLAISLVLQGYRSTGDLTELLANIASDIREDGTINDAGIVSQLISSTGMLNLPEIRYNLEQRYRDLGLTVTLPDFEQSIKDFLPAIGQGPAAVTLPATNVLSTFAIMWGTVNAHDLSTYVTFEYGTTASYGKSVPASENPVTGNENTTVSDTLTTLTPNTIYHFRVKATNVMGTAYGSDLTFKTLAKR